MGKKYKVKKTTAPAAPPFLRLSKDFRKGAQKAASAKVPAAQSGKRTAKIALMVLGFAQ